MDLKKYVEKEVNISSSPALQYAQDYIDSNHLYMRLASTEVFAISRDVGHKMMTGEYSGEEVRRIMDWLVNVKEDGSNPIQHRNLMPVTSGMEYTVTETERGKFRLGDITVNGQPLEDDAVYTVLLVGADTFLEPTEYVTILESK